LLVSILGTCGLAIALEVVSIVHAPTYGDYGGVLRTYNLGVRRRAWFAPRLGVEPPAMALPPLGPRGPCPPPPGASYPGPAALR
jgi:hypothetical protein